mmetsp:Transcript_2961/g.5716  ORF Transcript_2961/g.5716 Transcript_2961/m.5716 type:complete len:469 (-) Transcript_2961:16-1422(-)
MKIYLRLPCSGADFQNLVQENEDLLVAETNSDAKDSPRYVLFRQALGLDPIIDGHETSDKKIFVDQADKVTYQEMIRNLQIIVVSDAHAETDIVYMVAVSHLLKRVFVIFRGSSTAKDYKQDFKVVMATIPNPISPQEEYYGREEELGVHWGFRDYLYREESLSKVGTLPNIFKRFAGLLQLRKSTNANEDDETAAAAVAAEMANDPRAFALMRASSYIDLKKTLQLPCKYQVIIEQVMDVIEEHPDYRLFVTGHSLGGSLATMLSFEAAADPRIPGPVTCVTIGALKVGTMTYVRAFSHLEKQGRLRCVQAYNNRDIIPRFPTNGSLNICAAVFWPERTFRHVGLHLEFCDKARYIVHVPPSHTSCFGLFFHDLVIWLRFWCLVLFFIPGTICIFQMCLCIAIPCTGYCALHHGMGFDTHHAVVKYMGRLANCRDDLEHRTIEELNERRWERPHYKAARVHQCRSKQ